MSTLVEAEGLRFAWGGRTAIDDLSLRLHPGEIIGLLGRNGAGKTTLLRLLCGLLKPSGGALRWATGVRPPQGVGYAPQAPMIWPDLSVTEQLALVAGLHGLSKTEGHARTHALLDGLGLTPHAGKFGAALSGGMQRRLSIAMALVHGPRLLLLDEPEAGLDIEHRHDLWRWLRALVAHQGTTVLLSSHDTAQVEAHCGRVLILERGRLLADEPVQHLLARAVSGRRGDLRLRVEPPSCRDEIRASLPASAEALTTPEAAGELLLQGKCLDEALGTLETLRLANPGRIVAVHSQGVTLEHAYLAVTSGERGVP